MCWTDVWCLTGAVVGSFNSALFYSEENSFTGRRGSKTIFHVCAWLVQLQVNLTALTELWKVKSLYRDFSVVKKVQQQQFLHILTDAWCLTGAVVGSFNNALFYSEEKSFTGHRCSKNNFHVCA